MTDFQHVREIVLDDLRELARELYAKQFAVQLTLTEDPTIDVTTALIKRKRHEVYNEITDHAYTLLFRETDLSAREMTALWRLILGEVRSELEEER